MKHNEIKKQKKYFITFIYSCSREQKKNGKKVTCVHRFFRSSYQRTLHYLFSVKTPFLQQKKKKQFSQCEL